jgi:hypothetical protein
VAPFFPRGPINPRSLERMTIIFDKKLNLIQKVVFSILRRFLIIFHSILSQKLNFDDFFSRSPDENP